jgi:LPS-assembly protein
MFNRFIPLFLLLTLYLHAEQVELYASKIDNDENRTIAQGDIYLIREDSTIKADTLYYDKQNKIIEAYGNIFISQKNNSYSLTDYVFMDMDKKYTVMDKLFYMTEAQQMWISSQQARKEEKIFTLKTARLSSCNPQEPDWTIGFSTGDYDEEDEWVNLYNPVIYAGRVPVFYLPYLGIPTSTKRRSGLLRMTFGTSSEEGYIFKQPIYLAPQMWWDATWTPEIRSKRGTGNKLELRVADSPYSQGVLEAGKFNDYTGYFEEQELQHSTHTGVHLNYERNRVFADPKTGMRDALYIDYLNVSDVDYLSLQDLPATKSIPSKLNYLIYDSDNYFGVNAKYFIDTTQPTNDRTVQILPQAQYHANTDDLIWDNLLYSADYRFKNYTREEGMKAKEHAVTVPVSYSFGLFDDYVNVLLSNTYYYYKIDYTDEDEEPTLAAGFEENGQIHKDNVYLALFTDLSRGYESFFHNLNFTLGYTRVTSYEASGYFEKQFVTPTEDMDTVEMKFSQYFVDNGTSILTHRIGQSFIIYDEDNITTSDVENEINLKLSNGISLDSLVTVSHEHGAISKATHTAAYTKPDFSLSINNIFEKNMETGALTTNYYTYNAMYRPLIEHTFKADYNYDTIYDMTTGYGVEYMLSRSCWDLSLSFARTITPYLSSDEVSSKINDIIYLKINLNPLWGFEQKMYEYEYEREG